MRRGLNLMFKKMSLVINLSFLIICIDQACKAYIQTQYSLHESSTVIAGLFSITYARNFGAAFGFLENSSPIFRDTFMLSVPPLVCMIIISLVYFIKTKSEQEFKQNRFQLIALGLILGGALGNYLDRILYGYVIDFFDFYINKNHFPTFNIADMSIVCGVFCLIYCLYKENKSAATH
jgi:signal peptidase II